MIQPSDSQPYKTSCLHSTGRGEHCGLPQEIINIILPARVSDEIGGSAKLARLQLARGIPLLQSY